MLLKVFQNSPPMKTFWLKN